MINVVFFSFCNIWWPFMRDAQILSFDLLNLINFIPFFVLRPEIGPKWIFSLVTLTCNRRREKLFDAMEANKSQIVFEKKTFYFKLSSEQEKKHKKVFIFKKPEIVLFYVKRLFIQYQLMISETRGRQCPLGSFHCNSYAYFLTLPIIIKYLCKWVKPCLMFNDCSFRVKNSVFKKKKTFQSVQSL